VTWAAVDAAFRTEAQLDASAHAVLVALAYHSNGEGRCWPTNATLCRETRLAEQTVRRALRRLAEAGLVTVDNACGGRGKGAIVTIKGCHWDRERVPSQAGEPKENQKRTRAAPPVPVDGVAGARLAATPPTSSGPVVLTELDPLDPRAIEFCVWCDERGWLHRTDERGNAVVVHCTHRPRVKVTDMTVPPEWSDEDVNHD
jgi:hypothetical protein